MPTADEIRAHILRALDTLETAFGRTSERVAASEVHAAAKDWIAEAERLRRHSLLNPNLRIYCEFCGSAQPLFTETMARDELNTRAWGDLLCGTCHFVIATISEEDNETL